MIALLSPKQILWKIRIRAIIFCCEELAENHQDGKSGFFQKKDCKTVPLYSFEAFDIASEFCPYCGKRIILYTDLKAFRKAMYKRLSE